MKNKRIPEALLVNDIHVGKDTVKEFQTNWQEVIQLCKKYDIEDIIIGGDLWQSRSAQNLDTLLAVKNALVDATKKYELSVTIASGNHDLVDQESVYGYNHIFAPYVAVDVVNDYMLFYIGDNTDLYVMSYFPENGSFAKRLEELVAKLEKNHQNILYCHEGIRGGLSSSTEDELPAEIFSAFDKVLVGHYHDRKTIPGTNIEYIGASRQHNFGEDEEKGYTIVYSDGSTEFVKNEANIRYKVIDIDMADINDEFLADLERMKSDGRYKVKVRITNSKEATVEDKQKLLDSGASKVELVKEDTDIIEGDSQGLEKKFDKHGIKTEYTNFCSMKSIDVKLGLEYLDKIN